MGRATRNPSHKRLNMMGFGYRLYPSYELTLGVDRDSAIVAEDFDERDLGVKEMLLLAVED